MAPSPPGTGFALTLERDFKTTPDRVFEAFTTPEKVARWFCPSDEYVCTVHELDARVGGRYRFAMKHKGGNVHTASGTYEELTRPSRLVFSFNWESDPAAGSSRVTVTFEARGDMTRMHFLQENMVSAESRDKHMAGWNGCFASFERLF